VPDEVSVGGRPLADHLLELREQVGQCDKQESESVSADQPPTLVIQDEASSERAWQQYLAYFLDPEAPHGLGATVLQQFVEMLQSAGIVDAGLRPEYDDVIVRKEQSGSDSRPDLVVYEPGSWFLCMELKVYNSERPGQTGDHVAAPMLGNLEKETVPSAHHYYLYVAPRCAGSGEADEFSACPWYRMDNGPSITEVLAAVMDEVAGDVPDRTVHQMREFHDTIIEELSRAMIDEQTRELKQLYFEHREEINRVTEAFDEYAEWFFETRVPSALNGEYRPSYWGSEWVYKQYSGHTKLQRPEWHRSRGLQTHLEFYPSREKLSEGRIYLRFDIEYSGDRWKTPDGRGPQQVFAEKVLEEVDVDQLPDGITLNEKRSGHIHKLAEMNYSFSVQSDTDYIEAFQEALEDMAPLVPAVDQAMEWWKENHQDLEQTYSD